VRSIVLLDGDGLRGGGAPGWLPSLVVDPYYTALYRFITTSDWIFHTGLKMAYGPNAPHISTQEIRGWQRPFRVEGTAGAFKQMLPHGIQGLTLDDLARVRVPAVVAWGEHDTVDDVFSGRIAARVLRAPFVLLPRVGHLSMLADPSGVARAVERAAARNSTRRG
jgi:pimeloyl-ACP methyl ester carboxylesterase